ncbi:rab-GTPase-TBC domain-containing protein [Gorgonomyces haynaldii]|nr:rab-GTPase-TBC domain-containing protein [Gorgonomyces haynaldii]
MIVNNTSASAGLWSDSEEEEEDLRDIQMAPVEPVTYDNDAISAQALLQLLENENNSLAKDPKTVFTDNGIIRAQSNVLQSLRSEETPESSKTFWESFLEDPQQQMQKIPLLIYNRIRTHPIPEHLRSRIWLLLSDAKVERMKTVYPTLLSEDSKFHVMIKRDIPRTFPNVAFFQESGGEGQQKLFNVLKAYSVYDYDVGYCQGLSFCIGPLLMVQMTEIEAFAILVRLLEDNMSPSNTLGSMNYALRSLFTPDMLGLHIVMYQHSQLVKELLPLLDQHFTDHGITTTMYCSQWFLTFFVYSFPIELVFRIFDIMLVDNAILTMLRFSIAILIRNCDILLHLNSLESILEHTKGQRLLGIYGQDLDLVVKDAMDLIPIITQQKIDVLKEGYFVAEKSAQHDKMKNEVQQLRLQLKQAKMEAQQYKERMQDLEQENEKLKKMNQNLKQDLVDSDASRIQLLKDCYMLKSTLDAKE